MIAQIATRMSQRSAALLQTIDNRLERILQWWLVLAGLAAASRLIAAPPSVTSASSSSVASYMLLVIAPAASTLLALRWFSDAHLQPQPTTRLARYGRWVALTRAQAEAHPLYGTTGIMVSLLVGMMLNVPVRAAEYLAAMPPLPAAPPAWLATLHFAMTVDAVLFSSLYMIAFVAALRRAPLFPRLLLAIWLGDLAMQLITAKLVLGAGTAPPAVLGALHHLLNGNIEKVLISMAIWVPYLLLSTRVNVTYRNRVPA